jgi:hypothetical protein
MEQVERVDSVNSIGQLLSGMGFPLMSSASMQTFMKLCLLLASASISPISLLLLLGWILPKKLMRGFPDLVILDGDSHQEVPQLFTMEYEDPPRLDISIEQPKLSTVETPPKGTETKEVFVTDETAPKGAEPEETFMDVTDDIATQNEPSRLDPLLKNWCHETSTSFMFSNDPHEFVYEVIGGHFVLSAHISTEPCYDAYSAIELKTDIKHVAKSYIITGTKGKQRGARVKNLKRNVAKPNFSGCIDQHKRKWVFLASTSKKKENRDDPPCHGQHQRLAPSFTLPTIFQRDLHQKQPPLRADLQRSRGRQPRKKQYEEQAISATRGSYRSRREHYKDEIVVL